MAGFPGMFLGPPKAAAQSFADGLQVEPGDTEMTMFSKTLGGKQFWTDLVHCGGWRIQKNVVTGHCRLLDPRNHRHDSGTFERCDQKLAGLTREGRAVPLKGRVVIVLHGLVRTTGSMRSLGEYLRDEGGYGLVNFEYASGRRPIADHAAALEGVVQRLGPEVSEINFVGHSMGNIVVRHYLADLQRAGKIDSRFRRMVMIGPPNQGSKMARIMKRSLLFNMVTGPAGLELGAGWSNLEPHLTTPPFEFGIIAGGQSSNRSMSNLFLVGPDDFTVSLAETKLLGAADFLVHPMFHATMMRQQVTLRATLNFLDNGYFISADKRHPITANDE
jgi:pimeloyl-ACP methyl ester carboxylesterase